MKNLKLGDSRCECRACAECFNSVSAFDKHQKNGKCLSAGEMKKIGMDENASGYWVTELFNSATRALLEDSKARKLEIGTCA